MARIEMTGSHHTINPSNGHTHEEGHQQNDPTPWIVVKQLEHVHTTLQWYVNLILQNGVLFM